MSRGRFFLLVGVLAAAAGLLLWLSTQSVVGGPSSLSRGPDGWLAARLYLESQGGESALIDRPVSRDLERSVLVISFPWRRLDLEPDFTSARRFVLEGGTLLLAYSGKSRGFGEGELLERFGLETNSLRGAAPLAPSAWRAYQREVWDLEPAVSELRGARAPRVEALERAPVVPEGAEVLYRRAHDQRGLIFRQNLGKGRIVVLPTGVLANHQLDEGGNRDLLAFLASELGTSWAFDEYHHGLVAADAAREQVSLLPFDLFFIHLAALYVAGVWALARRFGPAWRESVPRLGSAVTFLSGLGRLHDRAGHHPDAALLLLSRVRELEPALAADLDALPDLDERAVRADRRSLVQLARDIALLRARRAGTSLEER